MLKSLSIRLLFLLSVLSVSSFELRAVERAANKDDEAATIKVVGKLSTEVVAIGGETTGTVITTDPPKLVKWQVEFPKNSELKQLAEKLKGRRVSAEGTEVPRKGVEVKDLRVILVTKLELME